MGIRKTISDSDTVKYVSRLLTGDDPTWRYRNRQGREQWFRELGGHSAHEHEEDFYSFIEPMTLSQRLAIRAFLEHMRDRHGEELFGESEAALELYWENVKREGTDS